MIFQNTFISELLVTLVAVVWFIISVFFHMILQIAFSFELLVTLVTIIWLFISVCRQMFLQIAFIFELLIAFFTAVWFFISVCRLMPHQIVFIFRLVANNELLTLFDTLLEAKEKKKEVALLLYDLSAAFDTVKPQVLLDKLKIYGSTKHH